MSTWPRVNTDVVHRRVGEEVVLVHLKTNQIFALNDTGARLWELLVAGESREGAERALLEEFEVEPDVLSAEIDALLDDLARNDVVDAG